MKLYELFEKQLNEVNMSPGSLKSWARKNASGITAGFEAELVFKNALHVDENPSEPNYEPDYGTNERANSIDEIVYFFSEDSTLSVGEQNRLQDRLTSEYVEWKVEKMQDEFNRHVTHYVRKYLLKTFRFEEEIKAYMSVRMEMTDDEIDTAMAGSNNFPTDKYKEAKELVFNEFTQRVHDAVDDQNEDYYDARQDFESNFEYDDTYSERSWLRSNSLGSMIDVANAYDIPWPHFSEVEENNNSFDGRYHSNIAQELADSLTEKLGVKTQVETGTRGHREKLNTPPDVWVFENDGSVRAENIKDMPIEIVSPPMSLEQTLAIMPKFFEWAKSHEAYTNNSTGIHMSVGMPEHSGDKLDYTKAVLFLGDKYVLEQFGRIANSYAQSALDEIKSKINSRRVNLIPADNAVTKALDAMRTKLNSLATRSFVSSAGFGKYYTINPKDNYIEFRSAGGKDYIKDIPKLQNTMLRYARAMSIGMDLDAEKQEYAKKLYKLLGDVRLTTTRSDDTFGPPSSINKKDTAVSYDPNDPVWLFARYVSGNLSRIGLINNIRQIQSTRKGPLPKSSNNNRKTWQVYDMSTSDSSPNGGLIHEFENPEGNRPSAIRIAREWLNSHPEEFRPNLGVRPAPVSPVHSWRVWNIYRPGNTRTAFGSTAQEAITSARADPENSDWSRGYNQADFGAARITGLTDSQTIPMPIADLPPSDPNGNYVVKTYDGTGRAGTGGARGQVVYQFSAENLSTAFNIKLQWVESINGVQSDYILARAETATQQEPEMNLPPNDPNGNFIIRARQQNSSGEYSNEGSGPVLYQFSASSGGEAVQVKRRWVQSVGGQNVQYFLGNAADIQRLQATNTPQSSQYTRLRNRTSQNGYWVIYSTSSHLNVAIIPATTQDDADSEYSNWLQSEWRPDDNYGIRPADPEDLQNARDAGMEIPPRNNNNYID
jgi:hypothetical protein